MQMADQRIPAEDYDPSVDHDSDSDPEVVLGAVKQASRVVVELNDSDIHPIACADVDTASKRAGKSGFSVREVRWTRTGCDGDTNFSAEVHPITRMRRANESMSEWLER